MRRSPLVIIGSLCVVLAVGALALWRLANRIGKPAAAERAAYNELNQATLPALWVLPSFALKADTGAIIHDADLEGHITILDFMFTTCTTVCPRITATLVSLQRQLPDPRLRFISVSVDPEHDTQDALSRYRKLWNAQEARWALLSPNPKELEQISEGMRVAVEPSDDVRNPILHSSLLFLVDADRAVRGIYNSEDDAAISRLVNDVGALLSRLPGEAASLPVVTSDESGEQLFRRLGCAACHENSAIAPRLDLPNTLTVLSGGQHVNVDRSYLETSVLDPTKQTVEGYLPLMPSYQRELDGVRLSRLVDYLLELRRPAPSSALPSATGERPRAAASAASTPKTLVGSNTADRGGTPTPEATGATNSVPATSTAAPTSPAAAIEVDPVCGMQVRVTAETPAATHAGHTYHFCSSSCREQFAADPTHFLPAH